MEHADPRARHQAIRSRTVARWRQPADVVAERLAEAPGLDEIALHVDHQQPVVAGSNE